MSNFDSKTGFIYIHSGMLNPMLEAVIEAEFDNTADHDCFEIEHEMKQTKFIKSIAMAKSILFPFEMVIYKVFGINEIANEIKKEQKIYWKFLRKKTTLKEFQDEIISFNSQGY